MEMKWRKGLILKIVGLILCTGLLSVAQSADFLQGDRSSHVEGAIAPEKVSNDSPRPFAVAVDPAGHLIVLEINPLAIVKIDPVSGTRTLISDATRGSGPWPNNLSGLALLHDGRIVSGTQGDLSVPRSIIVIDSVTGNRRILSAAYRDEKYGKGPGFSVPNFIDIQANGRMVVTDSGATNGIVEIDVKTGDRRLVSSKTLESGPVLKGPQGIAVDKDGFLFVVDAGDAIFRIDPRTSDRTIISSSTQGSGQLFDVPIGLILLPDQKLAVTDKGLNAVILVDLETGNRAILSGEVHGTGPKMFSPYDLAYYSDGQIVVTDPFLKAVFKIDSLTGNRSILFKY